MTTFARVLLSLSLFMTPALAQAQTVASIPEKIPVRFKPLKGKLDEFPLFNSNAPEIVENEGILLSTFAPVRKGGDKREFLDAHLSSKFDGRFGVFMHHISKQDVSDTDDNRQPVLHVALLAFNPGLRPVVLKREARATYLSQPDAPFVALPQVVKVEDEKTLPYAGPGDRVTWDFLSGQALSDLPAPLTIEPDSYAIVEDMTVPTRKLRPASNGRSYLGYFESDGALELATISYFADADTTYGVEKLRAIARERNVVSPRESQKHMPTAPGARGALIYGRVAGVSRGLAYKSSILAKAASGKDFAEVYPVSSLARGTFGTGEIQAAPLTRRYRDCAYRAQGNYGLDYDIAIKLRNSDKVARTFDISFGSPLKEDKAGLKSMTLLSPPAKNVFFRGTLLLRERPIGTNDYFHLVLHKGEMPAPLKSVRVEPGEDRDVQFRLFYPPDATPPQVLMITSKR